jgi:type I restriction enzyme S subunit
MMDSEQKFKETEIGRIPEEWEEKPISEIAEIYLGGTPSTKIKDYWNGKIKWASAKDISNCKSRFIFDTERTISEKGIKNSAAKLLPKGTIVITSRGTVGKIAILGEDMSFNQTCYGLKVKENYSSMFIFYELKNRINDILSASYGTVFNTITIKTFDELRLNIPPLPEQRAIAAILSSLDDKIELNQRMNKTLEAIGQALFKHWFVDFEFPNEEGKPYKSSGGEMVYSEELGKEIPKGWDVKLLSEVAEIVDCLHTKKPDKEKSNNILLQVYNIGEFGTLDLTQKYTISESDYKEWTKNIEVKEGDILFTNAGKVGAIGRIPFYFRGAIGRNITSARPKGSSIYLLRYLLSTYGKQEIDRNTDVGTIFNSLNVKGIRKIKILIPDSGTISKFNQIAEPLRQKVERNVLQNIFLSQIRDALLPKLMSGKIRVPVEV